MKNTLLRIYDRIVLEHPVLTLLVASCILVFFALQVPTFKLDASDDSLVLENDADLYYHRRISERYGGNDILVVAYTAKDDLFSPSTLADLKSLRDELRQLEGVSSVTTILDVPLLLTSGVTMTDLADAENLRTLENSPVEKSIALAEFNDNPLYRGRLVSPDGKTTALLLGLPVDQENRDLLKRRFELREKKYKNELSADEAEELEQVSQVYRDKLTTSMNRDRRLVAEVRNIMDRHRGQADLYLGGVPMIMADMIAFIGRDLCLFGLGVIFFLVITLTVIFRKPRWVMLSMSCSLAAVLYWSAFSACWTGG